MKILSISAQKPHSTGSGIYLSELVKVFAGMGHEQAVVAGVYREDEVCFPDGVTFYPAYFNTEELDFPIPGMSDEMPYESTVYSTMTEDMTRKFKSVFLRQIEQAVDALCPDVILCHHLYLLTAAVVEQFREYRVIGISHATDVRQMKRHGLEREYIKKHIQKLFRVYAAQEELRSEISQVYGLETSNIKVLGAGYNRDVFYMEEKKGNGNQIRLVFAGKLSYKKGVMSLIKSMEHLSYEPSRLILRLAGGYGNDREYEEICRLADKCKYEVEFLGHLSQEELAAVFRESDIFILPSFYEGLPLVLTEALACKMKVISAELPGVRQWMDSHIPENGIRYVPLPDMHNADEPEESQLPEYERKLAAEIEKSVAKQYTVLPDLSRVSWQGIGKKVIEDL